MFAIFNPAGCTASTVRGIKLVLQFSVRTFSTPWRLNVFFLNPLFYFHCEVYNTDFIRQMHYKSIPKSGVIMDGLFNCFSSLFFTYWLHSSNESILFLVWDLKITIWFWPNLLYCYFRTCCSLVICNITSVNCALVVRQKTGRLLIFYLYCISSYLGDLPWLNSYHLKN